MLRLVIINEMEDQSLHLEVEDHDLELSNTIDVDAHHVRGGASCSEYSRRWAEPIETYPR